MPGLVSATTGLAEGVGTGLIWLIGGLGGDGLDENPIQGGAFLWGGVNNPLVWGGAGSPLTWGLSTPAPGWVLVAGNDVAILDIDFADNLGWQFPNVVSVSSLLSCTRAAPATTYYTTSAGSLITFAANTARFGTNGLLVEAAATNLCTQSQDLENVAWTLVNATIGADVIAAPDGTITADKIQETATTAEHGVVSASLTVANATIYTRSVYLQAADRTWALVYGSASNTGAWFNLGAGTVGTQQANVTSATITALANNWYRCAVTFTTTSTTETIHIDAATGDTVVSYAGTAGNGIYSWGAQLETGSFATSYIPTTSSSVARNGDAITTANITWLTQGVGTFYTAHVINGGGNGVFSLNDGTSTNRVDNRAGVVAGSSQSILSAAGTNFAILTAGGSLLSTTNKTAVAYQNNDQALVLNAGSPASNLSGTVFTTANELEIGALDGGGGSNFLNGYIKRIAYFSTRVQTSVLQAITQTPAASIPSWLLTPEGNIPALDINYVTNQGWTSSGGVSTPASLLTVTNSGGYYTNAEGVLSSFSSNTLRTGDNGLLVEQSSTNTIIQSQAFTTSPWGTNNCTLTAGQTDPTATGTNAFTLTDNSSNNPHYISENAATSAAASTYSFYAKSGTGQWIQLSLFDGTTQWWANFDVINGVTGNTAASATNTITALANGWYRCTMSMTTASDAAAVAAIVALNNNASGNAPSYVGTGSTWFIFGAQLEALPFVTSYIVTTTTSASRTADTVSMSTSPWINIAAGSGTQTFYEQFTCVTNGATQGAASRIVEAYTDSNNRIGLFSQGDGATLQFQTVASSVTQFNNQNASVAGAFAAGATSKVAGALSPTTSRASVNANTFSTSGSYTVPNASTITPTNGTGLLFSKYVKRMTVYGTCFSAELMTKITT